MKEYEWTIEIIDENGDIVDSYFSESLAEIIKIDSDADMRDVGLVLNIIISREPFQVDRAWAYVKDGVLPDFFSCCDDHPSSHKVPARFKKELKRVLSESA